MKRSRLVTAVAAAGLAAGTLGLAGTASAAAAAPAVAGSPALTARTNYAVVSWYSEPPSATGYPCNGGADYQLPGSLTPIIAGVHDECSVRVWLHQNSNGSGYGFCISPGADVSVPGRTYHQLQITVNTAAC
jgi:hypothetical protein